MTAACLFLFTHIATASAPLALQEQRVAEALESRLQGSSDRLFGAGRSAVSVGINLSPEVIDYFKEMSEET